MHHSAYKYILLLMTAVLLLPSCVKYDALPFDGKVLPRRSGYPNGVTNDWIYFNLRTGEIFNEFRVAQDIAEGEQISRTDWDLAFCGYILRTNSGTSGQGLGAAADLGYGNYSKWTSTAQFPNDLEWTADDRTVDITMSRNDWNKHLIENGLDFDQYPWFDPNNGPPKTKTSANPVLSRSIAFAGPPPVYTPSGHTYAVRTADGKRYFKLMILSWFNANVEIGDEGGQISYYCDEITPAAGYPAPGD